MQIPSIPPPIVTSALPQDVAAKAAPNMQAAAPLVQNAVDPAPKSEKFNQTRDEKDGDSREETEEDRKKRKEKDRQTPGGQSINIRV